MTLFLNPCLAGQRAALLDETKPWCLFILLVSLTSPQAPLELADLTSRKRQLFALLLTRGAPTPNKHASCWLLCTCPHPACGR